MYTQKNMIMISTVLSIIFWAIVIFVIYVSVRDATSSALNLNKEKEYNPADDPDLFWCDYAQDYVDIETWEENFDKE